MLKGLIGVTPIGTHTSPNSSLGDKDASKNAQNTLKNTITSERMNRRNVNLKEAISWKVWLPARPSSTTVLVQNNTVSTRANNLINTPNQTPYFR
jgi:hypothetical protein